MSKFDVVLITPYAHGLWLVDYWIDVLKTVSYDKCVTQKVFDL